MSRNMFQIWDMELAAKLRQLRDKRGVSEREVSRAISKAAPEAKASPTTVGRWFAGTGMPSFIQAVELANYFEVPITFLAYDDAASAPGEIPEDEQYLLRIYRDLDLSREEAARGLALMAQARVAPRADVKSGQPSRYPPSGPEIPGEPPQDTARKKRPG